MDHINVETGQVWSGGACGNLETPGRCLNTFKCNVVNHCGTKKTSAAGLGGGRRWKVQVSDLFTTPSTSLWQLSYWLREALLTEKKQRKTSLLSKNPILTFSSSCSIKVPQYGRSFPPLSFWPYMHTLYSSGLSRLSASSTLIFSQAMLRPAARSGHWHSH